MTSNLSETLSRRFRWPGGAGVLLTGSHADGVAMRDANVNIMVIGASEGWEPSDGGLLVVRPMTIAANYIFPPRDLPSAPVVSIDVIRSERLPCLVEIASGMADIEDPDTPDLSLPVLDVLEIKALARLRSGLVLHGLGTVEHWRDQLCVSALPAFHCAMSYLAAIHFLRKADTAREAGLPVDVSVLLRMALEHLLISALAAEGQVLHEVKNLGRSISASLREAPASPRLLTEAGRLLGHDIAGDVALPDLLGELAADLLDQLPTARYGAVPARYLRAKGALG